MARQPTTPLAAPAPTPAPDGAPNDTPVRSTSPGRIELLAGCMFSGKTTELLRIVRARRGQGVAVFKHVRDCRIHADQVVTHNRDHIPARVVSSAAQIEVDPDGGTRLIAIDEAHFFDDALPEVCRRLALRGMDVVLTGLDRSSWGRPFPVIERLRNVLTRERRMTTRCARCGGPATRTQRVTPIENGQIVGGAESFEPRCVACWHAPPEPPVD